MNNLENETVNSERLGRLLRNVLLSGVSTLAMGAFVAPALAQNDSSQGVETVTVTGLRGSLQRSLDIKRDAVGVVDAISAEDIGKFPDSNLAAAIQRIPGISISRGTTSMGGVPTSTGDATQVTVRGFGPTFNETLYDGREAPTGIRSRGFDFSSVGADFVGEIDVLKTPDASMSSGAIGATINIKYPKPFDHPGLRVAASASATVSPEEGKYTPNGSLLFSDTFDNDKFGILADIAYTDHKTLGNHVNTQGWEGTFLGAGQYVTPPANPGATPAWFIQDYGLYQEDTEDKRIDGRVVLQWNPNNNVLFTLNYDYSRDDLSQTQYGYSVWFNGGSLNNVVTNSDGTVTDFVQNNSPTDFQSQVNASLLVTNEFGLNTKWTASDHFDVDIDLDHAEAQLNPGGELSSIDMDVGYGPSSPAGTNGVSFGISGIGRNNLPFPTAIGPGGNAARFLDPTIMGSHVLPISSSQNKDTINQGKVQGTWTEDKLSVRFGFQYLKDERSLRSYDSFANNDWQAYSGYGPGSNDPTGVDLPNNFFTKSFSTAGFINGFAGNGNLPSHVLVFDPFQVKNYLESLNGVGSNAGCCNPPFTGVYQIIENAGGHQDIAETSFAGFLTTSYDANLGSMPLRINAGVRYEQTDLDTAGIGQLPTAIAQQPGDLTAFIVTYGPASIVTKTNTYRYLLPNLDLNLSLTDDIKLRFDASRTLTRPPLNLITPVLNIPGTQRKGALVATGGNPGLLPYLSDNVDLGLEWYYAPNSYISVDGFVKEVTNFIIGGTTRQTINGVVDPTTSQLAQFSVTTNINGPSAEVRGIEFGIQHVFGDSGFGFQANATLVSTDKPYNAQDISTTGFAVTGLADSANLVAFYENYGFQARVALNWRDEYLDHFGQQQNNSAFGAEPTFVNASTQIDASTSYDITDNFQVYLEGLNLTDETFSTHGRYKEQILDVLDTGRRFTVGVHYKL